MFQFKKYGLDLAGLTILLVLLIMLLFPWSFPDPQTQINNEPLIKKITMESATITQEEPLSQVASLFGYSIPSRSALQATTSQPDATGPQAATWLKYTGTISKENGVALLYFKNSSTGRMLELNPDGTPNHDNWSLVQTSDRYYILSDGKNTYKVSR
ncbi:MAG: hypothetical protein EHM28_08885 [Spirochaetaceae bacterium]|nr:MAG: hypothetical protein EHM28_08885 [Spirochaetaceae bacterium]